MHKYIMMGPQGCGKGTQAKRLAEKIDATHISVGDIFRWHVQSHTKLGARVKRTIQAGSLVDDDTVFDVVKNRLEEHDWNYGFILDGFPRNVEQAIFFLEAYDIDAVIRIAIPDEVVHDRVMGRRICSVCGLDYHLMFHRPADEGVCDVCGGALIARADDNEEALKSRLADYHEKTLPTLDLFRKKELIIEVDGTQAADVVEQEINKGLGL